MATPACRTRPSSNAESHWRRHFFQPGHALLPPGVSMAHAALQYTLARPEVSTVIPGAKLVEQALDNFAAANDQLPAEVVAAIDALWDDDLKHNPLPW